MITISLCMIVRDEELTLPRCLDSVIDAVDEIIIVDTGSIDNTKEIAKKYTTNVYEFEWVDDFSAARNFSFSKAAMEYILWMDADDVLLEEDRIKLKFLKEQMDSSIDIYLMKYNIGTDDAGRPTCTYYRERLLKRANNYVWNNPVHEYINLTGRILKADIAVTHKKIKKMSSRNLDILDKLAQKGDLNHRNQFYYARELSANGRYGEALRYYENFLDQDGGFFSNYIDACIDLSKIYVLKGDRKNALRALIRSFEYGIPMAEICCGIGSLYKEQKDFEKAISWFEIAVKLDRPENTMFTINHDYYNIIPFVEMSICYFSMGLVKEAVECNERAAQFKPDSSVVINNRKYYDTIIKNAKAMP